MPKRCRNRRLGSLAALVLCTVLTGNVLGSENVPHRPFALWAELPQPGQFVAGLVYEESEAYHIWANRDYLNITVKSGGESYGIDINQGFLALQYGISERWAADLNVGYTSLGWRSFSPDQSVESTTGLMDYSLGVRYQLLKEDDSNSPWLPTLTFRAGAILPGTYDQNFVFAPGVRSAAIEPELLLRKHLGWPGFGVYADGLYRWNRTTGNDQYITVIGLFQQIKRWELAAGYRHLQTLSGGNITFDDPTDFSTIHYPRDVRENNDSIEAGFSYTTPKRHIRLGFHSRTVIDGSNTDKKFWVGGSVDFPFDLFTAKQ